MMIVYPPIRLEVCTPIGKVQTIVIEDQKLFYELTNDLFSQINGSSGDIVISENYVPLQLNKTADIITQFIPFTSNKKDILTGIYNELKERAVDEARYNVTQELYTYVEKYLYDLTEDTDVEIEYSRPDDISGILKAFDLHIVEADKKLNERLLEYMLAARKYKKRSVFVTVGLRNYISDRDTKDLFQSVLLGGLTLICLESQEHSLLENETRVIIDKDLCII